MKMLKMFLDKNLTTPTESDSGKIKLITLITAILTTIKLS